MAAVRRVLLSRGDAPTTLFELQFGTPLRIGRAPSNDVVITSPKVSGNHLEFFLQEPIEKGGTFELCARDTSMNGTGLVHRASGEPVELVKGRPQVVAHGSCFVVPLRTSAEGTPADPVEQTRFIVHFQDLPDCAPTPLAHELGAGIEGRVCPDAYDEVLGKGRWRYCEVLGEGGLGVVYRAFDVTGGLGNVAVKVSKWCEKSYGSRSAREAWQIFIMHREAQWSRLLLHSVDDPQYDAALASLFVRYLEDHTGFPNYDNVEDFAAARAKYEHPDVGWSSAFVLPPLPVAPYVVMELAPGHALSCVKPEETLTVGERRIIVKQAVQALEYLARFSLIHRDFRTSNLFVARRGKNCRLKVLDLGLAIAAIGEHKTNPNTAVKACWNRATKQYDWVPPEAKTTPFPNFSAPFHSFDVYSLGVLVLRLYGGKRWARTVLEFTPGDKRWRSKLREKGLGPVADLLANALGATAAKRPRPGAFVDVPQNAGTKGTPGATPGSRPAERLPLSAVEHIAPMNCPPLVRVEVSMTATTGHAATPRSLVDIGTPSLTALTALAAQAAADAAAEMATAAGDVASAGAQPPLAAPTSHLWLQGQTAKAAQALAPAPAEPACEALLKPKSRPTMPATSQPAMQLRPKQRPVKPPGLQPAMQLKPKSRPSKLPPTQTALLASTPTPAVPMAAVAALPRRAEATTEAMKVKEAANDGQRDRSRSRGKARAAEAVGAAESAKAVKLSCRDCSRSHDVLETQDMEVEAKRTDETVKVRDRRRSLSPASDSACSLA